tara:strand:+ start:1257 stop:1496 length:240 start_codon:yes stop_codon:yes gene_type:complete
LVLESLDLGLAMRCLGVKTKNAKGAGHNLPIIAPLPHLAACNDRLGFDGLLLPGKHYMIDHITHHTRMVRDDMYLLADL